MGTFRMEHPEVLQSQLEDGRQQYEASLGELGEVRWQQLDAQDERERVCDSCLARGFPLEAGGQSPCPPSRRVQHLWLHNSGSDVKARFDSDGCVGRVRCSEPEAHAVGARQLLRRITRP
ncbi:4Fe-4S dicluster domain-containing protein [Pseudomonas sp. JS3066]|uniref:4Fe-4S dicluster domain-containing protein n=1 Tax=Pseudomonas sp. JS3066 TaxID=3090665 RepID=UPI003FA77705